MSKYYLKADYGIQSLKFRKTEDTIVVDIPMLSHGKLNYGLEHVKTLLRSHNIFPSELGFDIIIFSRAQRSTVPKSAAETSESSTKST